ncbi:MAG: transglycosylase SLT domain-containing protein [Clostridium sp.]|nr:transglycosylase SLT domain-containing protein [Clostridium sp.]MCM1398240.1 transglycosylase SLT domain-containing protein [Clostridium sp.]MCM1460346.1 transglycosylase SLT domain-containing protein [Bacteroides sp.]
MSVEGIGNVDEIKLKSINGKDLVEKKVKSEKSQFDSLLQSESDKLSQARGTTYNLKDIFAEAAQKYGLRQDLLEAIGYHESRFQAGVTSSAGAMGIMQLMPGTARAMGVNDAYDPYENIMGAAKLLKQLSDLYNGDLKLTLAAYSAGTGNVAKYGGVPPFAETQNYVADIFQMLESGKSYLDAASAQGIAANTDDTASTAVKTDSGVKPAVTETGDDSSNASAVNNSSTKTDGTGKTSTAAKTVQSNENKSTSVNGSTELDKYFSYTEYDLLMQYFSQMLKIIASIGDTDAFSDDTDDTDDSLADLYKLSMQQRLGTIYTDGQSISTTTSQLHTTTMSDVAAKYMAVSNMLK